MNVLIVDADAMQLAEQSAALAADGHQVRIATTFRGCWDLRDERFDVIFCCSWQDPHFPFATVNKLATLFDDAEVFATRHPGCFSTFQSHVPVVEKDPASMAAIVADVEGGLG